MFNFTSDYFSEIWQIGVIAFALMNPITVTPFSNSREYVKFCQNMFSEHSSNILNFSEHLEHAYSSTLIELVQDMLIGYIPLHNIKRKKHRRQRPPLDKVINTVMQNLGKQRLVRQLKKTPFFKASELEDPAPD